MKKNLFYTFIILALVFGFSFFVGTQKTEATDLYYFLMYTKTQNSSGIKAPVPSVEFSECNKTRTEFMNSAPYLQSKNSNFKEGVYVAIPSFCIKETNPFSPEPSEVQNVEGQNDKPKDDTYTLLAPLGNLKTAPKNIGDYFNIIFNLAIGLCAVLAVVMIVIGGVQYMGDESIFGKTEAKSKIFSAVLGLIIALGSYALLNTINPDLLGSKGLKIDTVTAEIDNETESDAWVGYSGGGDTKLCPEGFIDVTGPNNTKINVCKNISKNMQNLLNKATAQKIPLSGSGTRSTEKQQELREKHGCKDKNLPSNKCTPPTARPGHSMHESGKAIDFRCNGSKIEAKDNECYVWLKNNTGGFLKNLKSEPWHWSTTGH
jgi:hypothetical protein